MKFAKEAPKQTIKLREAILDKVKVKAKFSLCFN
jgi:hypothetical protein